MLTARHRCWPAHAAQLADLSTIAANTIAVWGGATQVLSRSVVERPRGPIGARQLQARRCCMPTAIRPPFPGHGRAAIIARTSQRRRNQGSRPNRSMSYAESRHDEFPQGRPRADLAAEPRVAGSLGRHATRGCLVRAAQGPGCGPATSKIRIFRAQPRKVGHPPARAIRRPRGSHYCARLACPRRDEQLGAKTPMHGTRERRGAAGILCPETPMLAELRLFGPRSWVAR